MSGEVSKDEKERQLDAKIAAIRAKNEEKLQRQREVEKDRKLAEKQNQSITTAPRVKKEEDYEHTFVGPDRNDKVNSSKSGKTETRRDESFGSGEKMETKQRSGGRLRDGEGPPPDPGYRFLADRWRDGSESEGEEEENGGEGRRRERRREDVQPWSRGGGERGRGGGRGGVDRGRSEGRGGGRGRGGGERGGGMMRWSEDRGRQQREGEWGEARRGDRGRGGRGGGRGAQRPGQGERQTEHFIKDIRRNVESDRLRQGGNKELMRSESSDWNNSQTSQSPRHKPRPLMEEMRPAPTNQRPARGGGGSDWSDQVEDAVTSDWAKAANNSVPSVPTALVSPRRIEEMDSGRQTVTRSSDLAHTQTRPKQQPARQENSYPYGVEPPPFKENLRPSHSNHQASEIGFSMNSSHYSKPFPAQEPDKVNKAMMYSGREAQNYTSSSGTQMAGHQSHQRAANGYSSVTSNPAIPQPMLPQPGVKDWGVAAEMSAEVSTSWAAEAAAQAQGQNLETASGGWGGLWTGQEAVMTTAHAHTGYGMMAVPAYPPPGAYYQQAAMTQPFYGQQQQEYFTGGTGDFSAGFQPHQSNMSVFNPSAQVYVPPAQTPVPEPSSHMYKPPPPASRGQGKSYHNSASALYDGGSASDPGLMLALNKPPNPLSLRRPQDPRPSKLQERLNQNRQSAERERPGQRSEAAKSWRGQDQAQVRGQRPGQQRDNGHVKPPSMVEMQSGSLKKGSVTLPPPGKGNGLLVIGTEPVDSSSLSKQISVPVNFVPCSKLEQFAEKAGLLDPNRDWLVLINGLGPDARAIAETKKTDVEKANDADDIANIFCDIIESKILTSASHIYVLVQMLLPRIDLQEANGMGNPNNVRKVINVQITARLYENPRVGLINSDKILDWGDDNVKLNKLMSSDGFSLTEVSSRLVLDNWGEHIRKRMSDVHFVPSTNKNALPSVPSNNVEPEIVETKESEKVEEKKEEVIEKEEEDDDDVNDPFGSYKAPNELVAKTRTISYSEPGPEDTEDTDDSLPNLETVKTKEQLSAKMASIDLQESQKKPEFDLDNGGGFIEDNYLGNSSVQDQSQQLPSMMSLNPSGDASLVSGHFMEDSYLPPQGPGVKAMKTVEFKFRSSESVKIAGDFNSWEPQVMEREGEEWRCLLDLPAGQYAYKYFINGEWVLDEANKSSENEDGARNNVIIVQF